MENETARREIESLDYYLQNHTNDYSEESHTAMMLAIDALSKPQEPKTGHWIDTGSGQECSECHEIQYGYDNHRFYCGNCGARMEVEQNG